MIENCRGRNQALAIESRDRIAPFEQGDFDAFLTSEEPGRIAGAIGAGGARKPPELIGECVRGLVHPSIIVRERSRAAMPLRIEGAGLTAFDELAVSSSDEDRLRLLSCLEEVEIHRELVLSIMKMLDSYDPLVRWHVINFIKRRVYPLHDPGPVVRIGVEVNGAINLEEQVNALDCLETTRAEIDSEKLVQCL